MWPYVLDGMRNSLDMARVAVSGKRAGIPRILLRPMTVVMWTITDVEEVKAAVVTPGISERFVATFVSRSPGGLRVHLYRSAGARNPTLTRAGANSGHAKPVVPPAGLVPCLCRRGRRRAAAATVERRV